MAAQHLPPQVKGTKQQPHCVWERRRREGGFLPGDLHHPEDGEIRRCGTYLVLTAKAHIPKWERYSRPQAQVNFLRSLKHSHSLQLSGAGGGDQWATCLLAEVLGSKYHSVTSYLTRKPLHPSDFQPAHQQTVARTVTGKWHTKMCSCCAVRVCTKQT